MSNDWLDGKVVFPQLQIANEKKKQIVASEVERFIISRETALKVKDVFASEMQKSLTQDQHVKRTSCLLNELSFITRFPSGKEAGQFLSIDLGSTNFRVILSDLKGGHGEDEFHVKYYDVPQNLRYGPTCKPLFTFLAQSIGDFIETTSSLHASTCVPLAFSFSYPMIQKSHDTGFLVEWTKSYDLPDAINKDAVSLLRQAIKETKVNCEVAAILNDSTGTLLKGAYLDPDCRVGMIFGSGFNCAFIESIASISKLSEEDRHTLGNATHVALDIECGAFGDNGCIDFVKNEIDRELDADSLFKNAFSFEKMFAGNFFGDIVRRILHKVAVKGALFNGKVTSQLTTKDSLMAADCVKIERHGPSETRNIAINKLGYADEDVNDDDVAIIDYVGKIVAMRAAVLPSTLLSHLIDHIDRPKTVVAIDGSLYKHHPVIHSHMIDCISSLSPGKKFDIILAEDGSGKGAGLAAATLSTTTNNNTANA